MPTSALEPPGGLTGRLVWLGLIHSLWIGLLVASAAAMILQSAPRIGHRARHAILALAMGVVATGPIVIAPAQHAIGRPAAGRASAALGVVIVSPSEAGVGPSASPSGPSPGRTGPDALRPAARPGWASLAIGRAVVGIRAARAVVVPAWTAFVIALGSLVGLGGLRLRRLCRECQAAPPALRDRTRRLARLLRLRRVPSILIHDRLPEPFLCGLSRPAIVLPRDWLAAASTACITAVLAHELAHERRRDPLLNLAQRLVEMGLFFHPAVHWLSRSLRRERERCADALAVRLTGDPLALAEALQSIARLRLASPGLPAAGASLGGPSFSLLPRIQELIGMTPPRPRLSPWPFAALPLAGLLALMAVAAGVADDRPSPGPVGLPAGFNVETDRHPLDRPNENDRQISYEVRYVTCAAEPWRQLLIPRMKLLKQEADYSAWMVDDKGLLDLLTTAQNDTRGNVLQAPKVTNFDGATATIANKTKHWYVAGFEDPDAESEGFRPIVKAVEAGSTVEVRGTFLPHGTRLAVKVADTSLLALHTLRLKKQVGDQVIAPQYQVPSTADRRWAVEGDVPDGSSLVISLGIHDRPGSLPGRVRLASDLLGAVGLPQYHGAPYPEETLVIIGPRRIVLETEERPIRPASRAKVLPAPM